MSKGDGAICPKCGNARAGGLDKAIAGRDVEAGDITVCAKCVSVLEFQEDLTLRQITEQELNDWPPEEREQLDAAINLTRAAKFSQDRDAASTN